MRDQHSAQAELVEPHSPLPQRESTPRPSISPLSARASPVTNQDLAMQELDITSAPANPDDHDDAGSSSLSEPEDEDDVSQQDDAKNFGTRTQGQLVQQSLEGDSEAETEKLEQTPVKLRNHADITGRTPSKLGQPARADGDLSDPPSPFPSNSGLDGISNSDITAGKKRKRSDTGDSSLSSVESDIGESPRKRSHSSIDDDTGIVVSLGTRDGIDESAALADASIDNNRLSPDAQDTVIVSPAKPVRGRKAGKPKGKIKKDTPQDVEAERPAAAEQLEEELSAEAVAKSAEELKHKNTASAVFEDIAKQFTAFREKMFHERLGALNAELELLSQPDCKHPEYMRQVACIDARYHKQVSESRAFHTFKRDSLRRTTIGERSQLHSQYFQYSRELREKTMYKLGEDWYSIQKERRLGHQEKDDAYIYKFPTKRSVQIKQQAKYNQEVSVLSGIAKYVGFPAAPDIAGAEGDALEDDLKAMKISKRAATQAPQAPQASQASQAPTNQQPVYITHTTDWAEPATHSAKTLMRNLNGGAPGVGSPYTTPVPQRRALGGPPSSGNAPLPSDGAELPSSVIAAPPTDKGLYSYSGRDQGSPLAVSKHRQNGRELTGFRNISNVSGASTIDAPPDSAEKERERASLSKEAGPSQHMFDTGQLSRNGADGRRVPDVYSNPLFRPQEGAFGTPAPLSAPSGGA